MTKLQSDKLEAIEKTSLRVIVGEALEMCGLELLSTRRESRSLKFGIKYLKHLVNNNIFSNNPTQDKHKIRNKEPLKISKAHTEAYKKSTIPYLQRRLNEHLLKLSKLQECRSQAARRKGGQE